MDNLEKKRTEIDQIDQQIVELLAKRLGLAKDIGHIKQVSQKNLQDLRREHDRLEKLSLLASIKGLEPEFIRTLYIHIFEYSRAVQETGTRCLVAYQGGSGAYSTLAAKQFFKDQAHLQLLGFDTFLETLAAVQKNRADYAILPVENSITGSIHEVLGLLPEAKLQVISEVTQPIEHCLISLPGAKLDHIKRVYSHPQALMQCSDFLSSLGDNIAQNYTDTAMAVQKILQDADPSQAAIASKEAAGIYGLEILKTDIANQKNNQTRFVVLGSART